MIQEKTMVKLLYHQYLSPLLFTLSALFTEGQKQEILFFLGAAAALSTIAARCWDIYLKGKQHDKDKAKNDNENKL